MILILTIIIIIILFCIIYTHNDNHCNEYLTQNEIDENTIWTYWDQGVKKITPFYQLCIESWRNKNPKHKIIVVDKYNVYDYISKEDLPPQWENMILAQHKSDFVRIALLEKYGGIWSDISVICVRPFNSVFKQNTSLEGFAMRKYSTDSKDLSVFENWFITAKKGSKIIKRWKEELLKAFGNARSVEEMDKSYFDNIDYQQLPDTWYLSMHKVLIKLIVTDPEIRDLYFNDSNILEAEKTAFLHYVKYGWDSTAFNLLKKNEELTDQIISSNTPIIKIIGAASYFKKLNKKYLLSNKDSVIYKLFNFLSI
jgi:hypothetical protein